MDKIIKIFATGLGVGYLPVAPGTAGTVLGVLLFWALAALPTFNYLVFTAVFILFAAWVADKAQAIFNKKDPPAIVIDEVAGFLVTMAFHGWNWKVVIAAFILFRFFDILKPFPIRRIEKRFSSGFGVVLDDALAGIYANICLTILIRYL